MRAISGKEFAKILERNGWILLRIQGSHYIYGKTGSEVRLSVPIHRNQTLKAGFTPQFIEKGGPSRRRSLVQKGFA